MSQGRARTIQALKSLNPNGIKASRRYWLVSSLKALSLVRNFSRLNAAATDESFDSRNPKLFPADVQNSPRYDNNWSLRQSNSEFGQNPDGLYRENSMAIQKKSSGAYSRYTHNREDQNKILERSSNTSYEAAINVKISYRMKISSEEGIGGGIDQYNKNNGSVEGNQGNYNMGYDSLHPQSQYIINGSCNGNALVNQQRKHQLPSESIFTGMLNPQLASQSPPVEEKKLLGTIVELDAFCKDRKLKEAVEVLGLLELKKVSVDIPRYLSLMKACGESKALEEAKYVHSHLTRSVPDLDVSICNQILEMYSKCGSMEDAYNLFDKMPQRNLTSWDTMITWLAKNGHGEDAIEMFTEFKSIGLKPDSQMFYGVFSACSVTGDMREGLLHFESMTKTYNLIPSMGHYVSVIDMLGSSGYLKEALEFIGKMPIEPSVEVWEVMMNQSLIHGDLELGDRCAEIVKLVDPFRLDKQSKKGLIPIKSSAIAKEKKREKGKSSGYNLLDIFKNKVHEYRSGDTSHPEHKKLYSLLRCLKQHMKETGYVADTKCALHDIDEESKEEALSAHSERLALSQALLTSPARAPIRIIKNLRVCCDCHNTLKIISKLVGRLIVARDAKRFHHFENGECSCKDYW